MASTIDCYIKRIEGDITGLKFGTKQPQDLNTESLLERLKTLNKDWYDELYPKYYNALDLYRRKEKNKREKVW